MEEPNDDGRQPVEEERRDAPSAARVVELSTPIQHGQQTLTTITLQPMRARHMRAFPLEGAKFGDVLDLVSKISGLPAHTIGDLAIEDLMRVADIVGEGISEFPQIGPRQ